jgi:hypothetical protein
MWAKSSLLPPQLFLDQAAVKALVHAFVMFRLDYRNPLFADHPEKNTTCLHKVQNAAARLIFSSARALAHC